MSYTGAIEKGAVKLPPEAAWPDGTIVIGSKLANCPAPGRRSGVFYLYFPVGDEVTSLHTKMKILEFCNPQCAIRLKRAL